VEVRVTLSIVVLALSILAQSGKLEPIGPPPDGSLSESVRGALEQKGYRIKLADGSTLCDIWLRDGVPTQPKADISGAAYTMLAESTLVGAISFPVTGKDFRGQQIKPGIYTLRYALHPTDGNHMGISPIRDFLLLVPAAEDGDVSARYKFEELAKLSAKASQTNHPAVMSLLVPGHAEGLPSLTENELGHLVFSTKLKLQSGQELPVSLIVKGVVEQ
jgi:hypothetical protein